MSKFKIFRRASIGICMIIIVLVMVIGTWYGAASFIWHRPEAKKEITRLNQKLSSANTALLELISENTRLMDHCRWAMILEPVIDPESAATFDAVNEAIAQWKQDKG